MDIGLLEKNTERAIEKFKNHFGKSGEWFLKIVNTVQNRFKRGGENITDIIIRERTPPLVGILKNFFFVDEFDSLRVSREDVREFVRIALEESDRGYDYVEISVGKKKSVDFSFSIYGLGVFRINYSRDTNGDTLNVRVLDFDLPEFDDLGFPSVYHSFFKEQLMVPRKFTFRGREVENRAISMGGLLIHAGETGSGKTTSIAAELKLIADNTDGLIVTYEDPVEYRFIPDLYPKVRQIELYKHLEVDEIYRHFLRNSPSVGLIGEVRTREEYLNVLDLASRGHFVITTLHARNVVEAVFSYLGVIGWENRELFFSTVRAVVCHRLLLNKRGEIVPLYEILFMEPIVRSIFLKDQEPNFQKVYNYFYKESKANLVNEGVFYPFDACLQDRIKERKIVTEEEKKMAIMVIENQKRRV
jgi:twitching motility protein PilT